MGKKGRANLKEKLESVYDKYNKRRFVDPDPLLYLYDYPEVRDREIAGLVAACLAYGRVELIMKTVGQVLETMGPSPHRFLTKTSDLIIGRAFKGFQYRFAKQTHLVQLLLGMKDVVNHFGSLENCFRQGLGNEISDLLSGLAMLCQHIDPDQQTGHLLADPMKNSACKRSHLFLRWMVRKDDVDPGGWDQVSQANLIIPLDTHMYQIGRFLKFTRRKNPDKTAALEITKRFRKINSDDPVKYDFSLTRYGIRRSLAMDELKVLLSR